MINDLTPEQTAMLSTYRDKWLAIGLDTDPIDQAEMSAAIEDLYQARGFQAPQKITFIDGFSQTNKKKFDISSIWVGQLSAYWLGYQEFFLDQFGIGEEIIPLMKIAKAGGFIHFDKNEVIVINRPEIIKMRDKVLHCEDGPSIRFRDGFEVYSWRGTRVPKEWIMDIKSVDPSLALNYPNVEKRRALAEIIGWDQIIEMIGPKIIDEDNSEIGTLIEVDIPEIGKERFIRVLCGTSRQFALPVPPQTNTALEAQAFLHGTTLEEFLVPEIRT